MTNVDRQIERRLAEQEIRYTQGRRSVVAALAVAEGPLTASDLLATLKGDVPLSSLYRTLAIFEEVGVVTPHLSTRGLARYELSEWLTGHHHHLVCVECGFVEDVEAPKTEEDQVRNLVNAIASMASFSATNHALEIEGRCVRCA
ncbi:MAG: Fur family transcriptional regulator [Actinomycetota bacterium]|nr:Fur family transcriptional regulator [Actinomycetota bacterium]